MEEPEWILKIAESSPKFREMYAEIYDMRTFATLQGHGIGGTRATLQSNVNNMDATEPSVRRKVSHFIYSPHFVKRFFVEK